VKNRTARGRTLHAPALDVSSAFQMPGRKLQAGKSYWTTTRCWLVWRRVWGQSQTVKIKAPSSC